MTGNATWWSGTALAIATGVLVLPWLAWSAAPSPSTEGLATIPPVAAAARKASVVSSGIVAAIHERASEPGSGARRFEMTIRMQDGSLRVSDESGDAAWRVGDRVSLIGPPATH